MRKTAQVLMAALLALALAAFGFGCTAENEAGTGGGADSGNSQGGGAAKDATEPATPSDPGDVPEETVPMTEPLDPTQDMSSEAVPYAPSAPSAPYAPYSQAPNASAAPESNSGSTSSPAMPIQPQPYPYPNAEEYEQADENGFVSTLTNPVTTFSADVDTASYANLRRMINDNYGLAQIPAGAVRVEEMLNYFSYELPNAKGAGPFSVSAQAAQTPWNPDTCLLALDVTAKGERSAKETGSNLVLLIDVSGSMSSADKLPLLKSSVNELADRLTSKDTVSVVTYASGANTVLEGANGGDAQRIKDAVAGLQAGGSTNGEGGLRLAYELAARHFIEGGNNRIILASDGDLNVGISSTEELHDFVSAKRKTGVYLSVLGFGTGNYKDTKMETVADNGNGNYHYIDSIDEARKVLGRDLLANLHSVADDVKLQLEFNPAYVRGYRQIGYENRSLANRDFTNDKVDAAEMGAGHEVVVAFELMMAAGADGADGGPSRYQSSDADGANQGLGVSNGEWATVAMRYKAPGEAQSTECEYAITERVYTDEPSEDWSFATAVIEAGLAISGSAWAKDASLEDAVQLVRASLPPEQALPTDPYRSQFIDLMARLDKNSGQTIYQGAVQPVPEPYPYGNGGVVEPGHSSKGLFGWLWDLFLGKH